jgi:hypothetical protein
MLKGRRASGLGGGVGVLFLYLGILTVGSSLNIGSRRGWTLCGLHFVVCFVNWNAGWKVFGILPDVTAFKGLS